MIEQNQSTSSVTNYCGTKTALIGINIIGIGIISDTIGIGLEGIGGTGTITCSVIGGLLTLIGFGIATINCCCTPAEVEPSSPLMNSSSSYLSSFSVFKNTTKGNADTSLDDVVVVGQQP